MTQQTRSRFVAVLLCLALLSGAAIAQARTFDTYYTCLPGTVTAIALTNASAYASDQAFVLTLHDAHGTILSTVTDSLNAYESKVVFLNELVVDPDEFSWGLVHIDANVLLQIGVWIGTDSSWVSITNLRAQTLSTEGLNIVYYWYGANYANTENRRAGIGLVNPGEEPATGTVYAYDSSGELLNHSEFHLEPYSSAYFKPETVFPVGQELWGLIDVRSSAEILVISEYYDAAGTMLDVDIIDSVYYLQAQDTENGDS